MSIPEFWDFGDEVDDEGRRHIASEANLGWQLSFSPLPCQWVVVSTLLVLMYTRLCTHYSTLMFCAESQDYMALTLQKLQAHIHSVCPGYIGS
jgi:hypothetical protein